MKMGNAGIGFRLGAFAAFLLLALIAIGIQGWYTLSVSTVRQDDALRRHLTPGNAVDNARSAQVNWVKCRIGRTFLLRGRDGESFNKYLDEFNGQSATTQDSLQKIAPEFEALGFDTSLVNEAQRTHNELQEKYREALREFVPESTSSIFEVDNRVKGIDQFNRKKWTISSIRPATARSHARGIRRTGARNLSLSDPVVTDGGRGRTRGWNSCDSEDGARHPPPIDGDAHSYAGRRGWHLGAVGRGHCDIGR